MVVIVVVVVSSVASLLALSCGVRYWWLQRQEAKKTQQRFACMTTYSPVGTVEFGYI